MVGFFSGLIDSNVIILLISLLPVLELRGGILAASLLHVDWRLALIICIIGNLIPIPFILLFMNKIFDLLKNTRLMAFINRLERRIESKSAAITKYKKWGLFLFVAIPLPGTGAWTGAMVASFLKIPVKESILSISLGVLTAGVVMSIISYGVLGLFI